MGDNYDDTKSIGDSCKSGYSTCIGSTQNSQEKSSSPPSSEGLFKPFSIFGDSACGEPLKAQQLVIDFTPIDEIDTEYVQEKCNAFWEYIKSQPELQGLIMEPDPNLKMDISETSDTAPSPPPEKKRSKTVTPKMDDRTALSVLEFTGEQGLIDRAFEPKVPQSQCTLGPREYIENEPTKASVAANKVCKCSPCSRPCKKLISDDAASTRHPSELKDLNHRMNEWGKLHPKSMEPPGHPPALSHCVMQRILPAAPSVSLKSMEPPSNLPSLSHCVVPRKLS